MKFVVALFIATKAIKIDEGPSYLCQPIESGIEELVLSDDVKNTFEPKETLDELDLSLPGGSEEEEGITLEEKEIDVVTVDVMDMEQEPTSLMIFPGILDGTKRFQIFNDQGFLSDE